MTDIWTLYTRRYESLPAGNMAVLVDGVEPELGSDQRGLTYTYRWPDLVLSVYEMPADRMAFHISGFVGWAESRLSTERGERAEELLREIAATMLVVGVEADPGEDDEGRADELVGRLSGGLRPLIFSGGHLWDYEGSCVLANGGRFNPAAAFGLYE